MALRIHPAEDVPACTACRSATCPTPDACRSPDPVEPADQLRTVLAGVGLALAVAATVVLLAVRLPAASVPAAPIPVASAGSAP